MIMILLTLLRMLTHPWNKELNNYTATQRNAGLAVPLPNAPVATAVLMTSSKLSAANHRPRALASPLLENEVKVGARGVLLVSVRGVVNCESSTGRWVCCFRIFFWGQYSNKHSLCICLHKPQ